MLPPTPALALPLLLPCLRSAVLGCHLPPRCLQPEQCKDPANGGPEGGDCGWTNRCRGSVEGCKLGCRFQQSDGRSGWAFFAVLVASAGLYVGGGVGVAVRAGAKPSLRENPTPHTPPAPRQRDALIWGIQLWLWPAAA